MLTTICGDVLGGSGLADNVTMAVMLLVLFPILLMYNTKLAGVALVAGIVLLYRGKTSSSIRRPRAYPPDNDASI